MSQKNLENYIHALSKLFDGLSMTALQQILESGRTRNFRTGEVIIKQGELEKTLYVVLTGRCRAIVELENGTQILGDICAGEPIGEFALFTSEPRSASVYALRPTIVLELREENYFQILSIQPSFAPHLTSILIRRMRRNNLQKHLETKPKNIVIINLQAQNDISAWTDMVIQQFEETSVNFEVFYSDTENSENQIEFFNKLDDGDGIKFLVCDDTQLEWSKQCLIYADLVLVASDFYASSDLYPLEKQLGLYEHSFLNKKVYLLLLHPDNAPLPEHTVRWLEHRKLDLHIHFRKNNTSDAARFCRIMTNKAVGLVLGGGGAKGYAHIGALQALMENNIAIDFIGGTSAGALTGLMMAYRDFNFKEIRTDAEHLASGKLTSNDYAIPIVSLLSGKKVTGFLKAFFGKSCLEDFWISSYSISSNITRSSLSMLTKGPAWKNVLASISIPGVFPPVVIDNELYVDGGIMDNLPIQSMYNYPVGHIIAISLSSNTVSKLEMNQLPSSRTIVFDKLLGKKKYKLPSLGSILVDSMTVNSSQRKELNKANVSLYMEMHLEDVKTLENVKSEVIIDKGKEQMLQYLCHLKVEDKFW